MVQLSRDGLESLTFLAAAVFSILISEARIRLFLCDGDFISGIVPGEFISDRNKLLMLSDWDDSDYTNCDVKIIQLSNDFVV